MVISLLISLLLPFQMFLLVFVLLILVLGSVVPPCTEPLGHTEWQDVLVIAVCPLKFQRGRLSLRIEISQFELATLTRAVFCPLLYQFLLQATVFIRPDQVEVHVTLPLS